jgi:lipoate-protein ligase A
MTPCRLIVDPPQAGAWNMAVDEALLEDAADQGTVTLRFYQWSEPTLSLGYFQSFRERERHPASGKAALVRRPSGGGALLHDRELTYSLCLPADHPRVRDSSGLYETVHRSLMMTLTERNVRLGLVGDASALERAASIGGEPFLCFSRRAEADVVCTSPSAGHSSVKIVGSAQRRRRGAVLQHGAVLLAASPLAPELPGLLETTGESISAEELWRRWAPSLASALHLELRPGELEPQIRETAQRLQTEKYGSRSWTERR